MGSYRPILELLLWSRFVLGRNHALYAATVWLGAYPLSSTYLGMADPGAVDTIAVTTVVAAGAGVLPDLDHPDSNVARHYGPLSRVMSKTINSATGGHRVGTHSIACAVVVGTLAWLCALFPEYGGRHLAVVSCTFCASIGLALLRPSLNLKLRKELIPLIGFGVGWWTWVRFDEISSALWALAAGGVIVHILCDAVTKGGVPLLLPFSKRRFALGLFKVGGVGEKIATAVGILGLIAAGWHASGAPGLA